MRILVLDTIHGGKIIARALLERGYLVEMVDVYRGKEGISPRSAERSDYDLVIAPVHLYPGYPLLRSISAPAVTHHQAVRWVMGRELPSPLVEITGARGKTTTAHALAHLMKGPGVLHTSMGTVSFPGKNLHGHDGITPASLIKAASAAHTVGGWMIAEISLGFIGAGQLGILTSGDTYRFAGGEKDALGEKLRSGSLLPRIITPPGTVLGGNTVPADDIASVDGDVCRYTWEGIRGKFSNPLLETEAYRNPIALAAAAACIMGLDPSPLSTFSSLKGRMAFSWHGDTAVVDDSNSGTCALTAREAIRFARRASGFRGPLTLVIGKEDGAICEGFPAEDIVGVVQSERPDNVILVGQGYDTHIFSSLQNDLHIEWCNSLAEGEALALKEAKGRMVVLAVKTWR